MEVDLYPGVAMWACWLHNAPLYGPLYGETRCSHTGCEMRLNRFEYSQIRFGAGVRLFQWFLTDNGYLLENHGVPDHGLCGAIEDRVRAQPTPWYHVYLCLDSSVSTFWEPSDMFPNSLGTMVGRSNTETTTAVVESLRLATGVHKPLFEWQPVKDDIVLDDGRVFSYAATTVTPPKPWERAVIEAALLTKRAKV